MKKGRSLFLGFLALAVAAVAWNESVSTRTEEVELVALEWQEEGRAWTRKYPDPPVGRGRPNRSTLETKEAHWRAVVRIDGDEHGFEVDPQDLGNIEMATAKGRLEMTFRLKRAGKLVVKKIGE